MNLTSSYRPTIHEGSRSTRRAWSIFFRFTSELNRAQIWRQWSRDGYQRVKHSTCYKHRVRQALWGAKAMAWLWRVLLGLVLCVAGGADALADKRVALVIGNSAYRSVSPLDNPANDANLMADTLRALGFSLIGGKAQLDLDKAGFASAVQNFGTQLQGADVALFYYAGHGVQLRGSNYLVPVNANPTREADVDFQWVDVELVLHQMEGSGTRLNMLILDACRTNPLGGRGLRAASGGLAQMQAPEGTLISYATQPGNVAQDGADGNSPFTKALAKTIGTPGRDIFQTFNEVGLAVKRATGGSQQPWVSSSPIHGNFFLAGTVAAVNAAPAPNAPAPPLDRCAIASEHWKSAEAIGTQSAFEDHLTRFPSCAFAGLARAHLDELQSKVAAVTPVEGGVPVAPARRWGPADSLRRDLVTECDRLAASPYDAGRPETIAGVDVLK